MIELGCNYSPQLMKLLACGTVDVDWIKLSNHSQYHEELSVARPLRPVLLHVYPHAGQPSFDDVQWVQLNATIIESGSPHIALHLACSSSDWNKPVGVQAVVERMISGVSEWVTHVQVPMLIENVPYFGFKGTFRCATDPDVIREVCDKTGARILLDIAHARVSCVYRQEDIHTYLRQIPLDYVDEIHVNAPGFDQEAGYFRDRHFEMEEIDYQLLQEVLDATSPTIVTLEYGGTGPHMEWRSDIRAIERQLIRLRKMLSASA